MTRAASTLSDVGYACYVGYHHECKKELPDCICPCHGECPECGRASHTEPKGDCGGGYQTIYPGWREEG